MTDRKKITTSVKLFDDQIESFKLSGKNMSETIRRLLDNECETIESISFQIEETENNLKNLKTKKDNLKEHIKKSNPNKVKFFKEAKMAILKNSGYIVGQMARYRNTFGESITKKKMLEECELWVDYLKIQKLE